MTRLVNNGCAFLHPEKKKTLRNLWWMGSSLSLLLLEALSRSNKIKNREQNNKKRKRKKEKKKKNTLKKHGPRCVRPAGAILSTRVSFCCVLLLLLWWCFLFLLSTNFSSTSSFGLIQSLFQRMSGVAVVAVMKNFAPDVVFIDRFRLRVFPLLQFNVIAFSIAQKFIQKNSYSLSSGYF